MTYTSDGYVIPDCDDDRVLIKRLLDAVMPSCPMAKCSVHGDVADDGTMRMYGVAVTDEPFDIMRFLHTPQVGGRVGLAVVHGRFELRWQYDGQPEYVGGDGPASNAAVLLGAFDAR